MSLKNEVKVLLRVKSRHNSKGHNRPDNMLKTDITVRTNGRLLLMYGVALFT